MARRSLALRWAWLSPQTREVCRPGSGLVEQGGGWGESRRPQAGSWEGSQPGPAEGWPLPRASLEPGALHLCPFKLREKSRVLALSCSKLQGLSGPLQPTSGPSFQAWSTQESSVSLPNEAEPRGSWVDPGEKVEVTV